MTAGCLLTAARRNTSKASHSGRWISRNSRSGSMSRIAWMADSPSPHSPTTSTSRCEARCRTIFSRAKGSSSMTKVRIMPIVSGPVGKFHGDTEAAARTRADRQALAFPVEGGQAGARVGDANAFVDVERGRAFVFHLHHQRVGFAAGADPHLAAARPRADAV